MTERRLRLAVSGGLVAAVLLAGAGAAADRVSLVAVGAALLLVAGVVEVIWRP